jgi:hypothetical protein
MNNFNLYYKQFKEKVETIKAKDEFESDRDELRKDFYMAIDQLTQFLDINYFESPSYDIPAHKFFYDEDEQLWLMTRDSYFLFIKESAEITFLNPTILLFDSEHLIIISPVHYDSLINLEEPIENEKLKEIVIKRENFIYDVKKEDVITHRDLKSELTLKSQPTLSFVEFFRSKKPQKVEVINPYSSRKITHKELKDGKYLIKVGKKYVSSPYIKLTTNKNLAGVYPKESLKKVKKYWKKELEKKANKYSDT